jgi:hypothetical protein
LTELISSASFETSVSDGLLDLLIGHAFYCLRGGEFSENGAAPAIFEQTAGPSGSVLHLTEKFRRKVESALAIRICDQQMQMDCLRIAVYRAEPIGVWGEGAHEFSSDLFKLLVRQILAVREADDEVPSLASAPMVFAQQKAGVEGDIFSNPVAEQCPLVGQITNPPGSGRIVFGNMNNGLHARRVSELIIAPARRTAGRSAVVPCESRSDALINTPNRISSRRASRSAIRSTLLPSLPPRCEARTMLITRARNTGRSAARRSAT